MGWGRPDVEMGVRDILTCIKTSVESGTNLSLAMGTMGTLKITSTNVDMRLLLLFYLYLYLYLYIIIKRKKK